uniref:sugar transferase n=1 Tax=uncultured Prochlorococcus sp. TaxID=159733 RepID=UPI00258826B7
KGIKVFNILQWCEKELHRIPPYLIENKYQIIEKFNLLDNSYKIRIKRIGDFIISLFLIIFTLPISIIVALLIYLEDKGPIFYSQIRTGFNGEKIVIYKFRSMVKNAEKSGPQWSQKEDKRITKIGKIIRALRLDELPQLLSVIEGTMSLIGPRPERPEIENKLFKEIPYYKYRHILKPGISGWAQVNYPYGASKEDTVNKLSYDIYYINHISFFLDLFILFKTMKIVFNAKNYKPKSK